MDARLAKLVGVLGRALPRQRPAWWTWPYVAWTLACFLFFFAITFPHDLIVRQWVDRFAAQSGWQVRYGRVWLRPWNGYHLAAVEVVAPGADSDPWVSLGEIVLRPSWGVLIGRGALPLSFSASAYGGEIDGTVQPGGGLDVKWDSLGLAEYTRLTRLVEGTWSGDVSGEVTLRGMGDVRALEGAGKVSVRKAALTQGKIRGFTVPDLHFASGDGEFTVGGGRVEVRQLRLSGSEVDADARGQIFLAQGSAVPTANLVVNLKPIPGANPNLEPMLLVMKGNQRPPNGIYTTTLYGPLNALRAR